MGTDIHGIFQKRTGAGWEDIQSNYTEDRHYLLFAWLGNVRNGFGFAGVPTHTPVIPLSDQRGYPEDFQVEDDMHPIASNEMRGKRAKYYTEEDSNPNDESYLKLWMGDHSHGWLTADEILSAGRPKIERTGIITVDEYAAWDKVSAPEEWCGGISGPKIVVSLPDEITKNTTHVQVSWTEDTAESLKYFVDEVQRLKDLHGEVRYVFGFDS